MRPKRSRSPGCGAGADRRGLARCDAGNRRTGPHGGAGSSANRNTRPDCRALHVDAVADGDATAHRDDSAVTDRDRRADRNARASSDTWPYARRNSPRELRVPILMYHYISTPPAGADIYRKDLSVTPERFAEHLRYLPDAGYTAITLDDLLYALAQGRPLPARSRSS